MIVVEARQLGADAVEFVRVLAGHGVRYLLVGGHAVVLHGYPRFTADIDFAYDRSPANCARLYRALLEFWGGEVPAVRSAEELELPGIVIQFGRPPNRIDLLSEPGGLDFDRAWMRRVTMVIRDGATRDDLHVVALTDLRAMKAAAGRARDLDDLEHLPPAEPEE